MRLCSERKLKIKDQAARERAYWKNRYYVGDPKKANHWETGSYPSIRYAS
jgi:hypothetical protein